MTSFQLDHQFVESFKDKVVDFGFNGLGKLVYERTYSRLKKDGVTNEQWFETCERVVNGTFRMQERHIKEVVKGSWCEPKAQRSAQEMYRRMFDMKFLPPGRGLWAMGSPIVEERHLGAALNNCAFVSTQDLNSKREWDFVRPFTFLMDASMLGVGVGFDTKGSGKLTLKPPETMLCYTHRVEDSREGWVGALHRLLASYHPACGVDRTVYFDYSLLRKEGTPIKGFGGVASGHKPLEKMLEQIRGILDKATVIGTREIVDIMNLIGTCVVAGNVRRTAEIAFGDPNDDVFLNLKNYEMNPERAEFGWTSNNSVFAEVGMDYSRFVDSIRNNGEPGFAWLSNMQRFGRMMDKEDNADHRVLGGNPCLTADTRILTNEGIRNIADLIDRPFVAVVDGEEYPSTHRGFWKTFHSKPIYELKLHTGLRVRATDNHPFLTSDGKTWVELKDLSIGESLILPQNAGYRWEGGIGTMEEGYIIGALIADGSFFKNKQGKEQPVIDIWVPPAHCDAPFQYEPLQYIYSYMQTLGCRATFSPMKTTSGGFVVYRLKCPQLTELVNKFGVVRNVKAVIEQASYEFIIGQLRALFDFDGTVGGNRMTGLSIRLSQSDMDRLLAVQRLLSAIGISSTLYENRHNTGTSLLPDGKGGKKHYPVKPGHELAITGRSDCTQFRDIVSCMDKENLDKLNDRLNEYTKNIYIKKRNTARIVSITATGVEEPVYDCTIPGPHRFSANGIIASNCLEQSLESFELCCLVELFPSRHETLDDFLTTIKYAYMYAKTVTLAETHWPETNEVMKRNRRIGCSVSGITEFIAKRSLHELRGWLLQGYDKIHQYDHMYSLWFGVRESIKKTSVKPSGTVSLLAGVTPGVHYPQSLFYIRRIRVSTSSPWVDRYGKAGYHVEPCVSDPYTTCISFPVKSPDGIRTVNEVTMWEQLELAALLQSVWSDNQVSCTVTFDPETESKDIAHALDHFQYKLKGISFLPKVAHGAYAQMPYEEITEKEYKLMCGKIHKDMTNEPGAGEDAVQEIMCDGESCAY